MPKGSLFFLWIYIINEVVYVTSYAAKALLVVIYRFNWHLLGLWGPR